MKCTKTNWVKGHAALESDTYLLKVIQDLVQRDLDTLEELQGYGVFKRPICGWFLEPFPAGTIVGFKVIAQMVPDCTPNTCPYGQVSVSDGNVSVHRLENDANKWLHFKCEWDERNGLIFVSRDDPPERWLKKEFSRVVLEPILFPIRS